MNNDPEINPWRAPATGPEEWRAPHSAADHSLTCPECSGRMEPGCLTTGAWLYWRDWNDRSMLVRFADRLPNTLPSFVGINRLSGFQCERCEVVVFRYGSHRLDWKNSDRP